MFWVAPSGFDRLSEWRNLLVEGLGVGGGGRDVGVTGSLVRAGGELELVGGLEVGLYPRRSNQALRPGPPPKPLSN